MTTRPSVMMQQQDHGHSALKSSGTSPNFLSTTASENSPTIGSPARLNATTPALAGSRDIPSARLIAAASLWHSAIAAAAAQRRDCATARSENREQGDPATATLQRRHSDRGNAKCLAFCRRWGSSGTPEGSQGYWHAGDPSRDHRRIEEAGFSNSPGKEYCADRDRPVAVRRSQTGRCGAGRSGRDGAT